MIGELVKAAGEVAKTQKFDGVNSFDPDKKAEISHNDAGKKSETKDFNLDKKAEVSHKADANDSGKKTEVSKNSEVEQVEKKGGSYKELKDAGHGYNRNPPEEVHHMPADEVSPLERNDGPAIAMEKEDHRQTASCGNSLEAREYRAKQKELIEQGKFEEAMQMDIDDIHEKFGDKYDDAIAEMKEYYNKLKEDGRV